MNAAKLHAGLVYSHWIATPRMQVLKVASSTRGSRFAQLGEAKPHEQRPTCGESPSGWMAVRRSVRLRRAGLRLAPPSAEAPDGGRSAVAPAFPAWSATSANDLRLGESILKGRAVLSADSVDNGAVVDAAKPQGACRPSVRLCRRREGRGHRSEVGCVPHPVAGVPMSAACACMARVATQFCVDLCQL